MTPLKDIMDIMIPLIPDEYMSNVVSDYNLVKRGIVDMAVRLQYDDIKFIEEEDGENITLYCDKDLSLGLKWLSAEFSYRAYLLKLKDLFNRSAINFETLTFKVKGLEKRPENIDSTIYRIEKQLQQHIDIVNGTDPESVIGVIINWKDLSENE